MSPDDVVCILSCPSRNIIDQPCLGVGSLCEFGQSRPDLMEVHASLGKPLRTIIAGRIRDAKRDGDVRADLDP